MVATTPTYSLPYPTSSDPFDDALMDIPHALALQIESTFATFGGVAAPTAWVAPTLGTNVSNFGGGFYSVGYRKVGSLVYLRGVYKPTSGTLAGGSTVFTLPTGFRPTATVLQASFGSSGMNTHNVSTAGVITNASGIAAAGYATLDHVYFFVD